MGRELHPRQNPAYRLASQGYGPLRGDSPTLARGAVDDKGQVVYHLEAVRALLARDGTLPVNLKFLVEGEEEVGSPNFEALLAEHRTALD